MKTLLKLILALCISAAAGALRAGEIEVRGGTSFLTLISSGDTTPSTTDGTDFGTINVGDTVSKTFRINNVTGASQLFIGGVSEDGAAFDVTAGGGTGFIGPNGSREFTIRFDATSAGTKQATVTVINDDANEAAYTFAITGEALGNPEIVVRGRPSAALAYVNIPDGATTPSGLDGSVYSTQPVSSGSETHTFQIENTGDAQLVIDSITDDSSHFTVGSVPAAVGVNQTQTFTVTFNPTAAGSHTAVVTIQNNDSNEDPFTFTVFGTGEAAEIDIRGGTSFANSIASGDTTPNTTDGTDFGTVNAGGGSVTKTFRIFNTGNMNLLLNGVSEDGAAFDVTSAPALGTTVAPGATRDFTIKFEPDSAGTKTALVTVVNTDSNETVYTFTITGEALGDPEIVVRGRSNTVLAYVNIPDGAATPSGLDGSVYSTQPVSSGSETHTFQIENTGDAQLVIDSITDDSSHFTVGSVPAAVGVNQTQTFTVTFNPTASGSHTAVITIQNNDANEDPFTFTVYGTGEAPEIDIRGGTGFANSIASGDTTPNTTDGTDFGTVNAGGGSVTKTFRVFNTGNMNLLLNGVSEDGSAFDVTSAPALGTTVAPGATRDFTIKFEPTSAGTKTALVTVVNTDSNETVYTFTITGEALGNPEIVVRGRPSAVLSYVNIPDGAATPSALDGSVYSTQPVSSGSETHTFQIENTGDAQLVIDSITDDSAHFSVGSVPAAVGVNQTQTFTVTFDPTVSGSHTAVITIQNNDANEDPFTFTVYGTGEAPEIDIRGGTGFANSIANGDTTPNTTDGTDFGTVNAGGGSVTKTFRVFNTGNMNLLLNGVSEDGSAFDVTSAPALGTTVAPGASRDFTIKFEPASAGTKTALVTVVNTDSNETVYTFTITGEALGNPEIVVRGRPNAALAYANIPDGAATPSGLDGSVFSNQAVSGGTETHTFQIENTGDAQLVIDSITDDSSHFSVGGVPAVVGVNQSQTFTVTFNPASFGSKTAVITIQNNDANEDPFTFTVYGTGTAPDIAVRGGTGLTTDIPAGDTTPVTTDGTDYGLVNITGVTVTRTFRIRNDGNDTMIVSAFSSSNAQFTLAGVPGVTSPIPAGGSNDFTVTFDPTSTGLKTSVITLITNDPDEAGFTFTVEGFGSNDQPAIRVIGDNSVVFTKGQTNVSANAGTDFGSTDVAAGTVVRTFEIENTGTGALTVTGITEGSAHFSVSGIPAAAISPGASDTFTVTFDPTAAGTHNATVSIASNDADDPAFTFAVQGTGTTVAPAAPEIALYGGGALGTAISSGDTTPRLLDGTNFGQIEIGSSVSQTFRIRNTGNAPLTITSSSVAGTGATISGVAASVAAGAADDFTLTFTPTVAGVISRTVTIVNNDTSEGVYTFTISAEGVVPSGILAVTALQKTGNDLTLTFVSIPGRTYRITASTPMTAGTWLPVAGLTGLTGDSTPQAYTITDGANASLASRAFYRVEQE